MSGQQLILHILQIAFGVGWAAAITGRAFALTWRPVATLFAALILLTIAARLLQWALFQLPLNDWTLYLLDAAILLPIGWAAFRATRAWQLSTKYFWLFERTGPLSWRER
jgi:hypothetical protein